MGRITVDTGRDRVSGKTQAEVDRKIAKLAKRGRVSQVEVVSGEYEGGTSQPTTETKVMEVTQVPQQAPPREPTKDLVSTKELADPTAATHTATMTAKGTTKEEPVYKQIVSPETKTIERVYDSKGNVVGVVDTTRGFSEAAPEGTAFREESIQEVEQKRAEQIQQQALLESETISTQQKLAGLKEQYVTTQTQVDVGKVAGTGLLLSSPLTMGLGVSKIAKGGFITEEEVIKGTPSQAVNLLTLGVAGQAASTFVTKPRAEEFETKQKQVLTKYGERQIEIYTGKKYKDIQEELSDSFNRQNTFMVSDKETLSATGQPLTMGGDKPQTRIIAPDLLKVDKIEQYYDKERIESVYEKTKKGVTYKDVDEYQQELKDSGYYYLRSRPQEVTITKQFQEEEGLRLKGLAAEGKIADYYAKTGLKAGATFAAIAVGGAYATRALQVGALSSNVVVSGTSKFLSGVGGKALQAGYGISLGARGIETAQLYREGKTIGATGQLLQISSEIAGVRVAQIGSKQKVRFEKDTTIIKDKKGGYTFKRRGTIDEKAFGGKFKKDIVIEGYVTPKSKIAYKTTTSFKGKTIKQTIGRVDPIKYKVSSVDTLNTKLTATYKGYEQVVGTKVKKQISFKGDIYQTKVVGRDLQVPSRVKNLYGVKTGKFDPKVFYGKEGITINVGRTQKGIFTTKTVKTFRQQALTSITGEQVKLLQPTFTQTEPTTTTYTFKGSSADLISKNILKYQAMLLTGGLVGQKGTGLVGVQKPKVTPDTKGLTGLEQEIIIPTSFKPSVSIVPITSVSPTDITKRDIKDDTKSISDTKLTFKRLSEQKPRQDFQSIQEVIKEQDQRVIPKTSRIVRPEENIVQEQIIVPDQNIVQEQVIQQEQIIVPDPDPLPDPDPVPFIPVPFVPLPLVVGGQKGVSKPATLKKVGKPQ